MIKADTSQLRKLVVDLDNEAARVGREAAQAVRKAGSALQRDARNAAPRQTGALQASIALDIYGSGRGSGISAVVGPTVRYGFFVERGTAKMAAQPFLGPALERQSPLLVAALERIAGEALS